MYTEIQYNNELYHHGIKGQKWGVRRYQNADGSYTSAGRNRYGIGSAESVKAYKSSYNRASSMQDKADEQWREVKSARMKIGKTPLRRTIASARNKTPEAKRYNKMFDEWSSAQDKVDEQWRDAKEKYKDTGRNKISRVVNNAKYDIHNSGFQLSDKQKKAIKVGAIVAGTALAAYATYKIAGPKIVAYRNNKAVQKAVSEARTILRSDMPNQYSRNYAKKTIFNASNRTRRPAVDRLFTTFKTSKNNVYGIETIRPVNVARARSMRNRGADPTKFRVSGRASTNSPLSRRGVNRSYTEKVRSDNAKVKEMTSKIMKDHNWDSKTAEQYAWYQLRNRGAYYN